MSKKNNKSSNKSKKSDDAVSSRVSASSKTSKRSSDDTSATGHVDASNNATTASQAQRTSDEKSLRLQVFAGGKVSLAPSVFQGFAEVAAMETPESSQATDVDTLTPRASVDHTDAQHVTDASVKVGNARARARKSKIVERSRESDEESEVEMEGGALDAEEEEEPQDEEHDAHDEEEAEVQNEEQEDGGPFAQSSPAGRPSHHDEQDDNSFETDADFTAANSSKGRTKSEYTADQSTDFALHERTSCV